MAETITTLAIRLTPGQDLKKGIQDAVNANNIKAGWIMSGVGSLTHYHLRFANRSEGCIGVGHFEIVNIAGTVSTNGSHIHLCLSDAMGDVVGGHLQEGCIVYTTAEIILAATDKYVFSREHDSKTGWKELQIK
jgi:uncharacterized protein